jgi:tripartite-type tricarboxylate transporter receptor subunit TctC
MVWSACSAPLDMPGQLRERIASDIGNALSEPTVAERLTATGQAVAPGTAAEFAAAIAEQRAQLAASAQTLGITPKQ